MDLTLTEEQEMLRKQARGFLENECPKSLVREMEDERGYSPQLWRKMAELGWLGLVFPEEYGGIGGSFLDLTILLEEFGRALVPSPFLPTVVYCGLPILAAGTVEQKQDFLPKIAAGEIIMSLAWTEPSASYRPSGIAVEATPSGDDYIISGIKLFVPDAHIADWLLCVTRTGESEKEEEGVTIFLMDAKSSGLSYTPLSSLASDKQFEVVFDGVRVPKRNMLGELDYGWEIMEKAMGKAAIAQCALMVGGAQQVLEMSVAYASERVQFGRPIGSFQAIQHKCANMSIDLDGARFTTYRAAWELSEGLPATTEVAIAKAWTSEAYRRICAEGHQIHGALGFSKDHDMQLYFRRAKVWEVTFGNADFHRHVIAEQMGL